MQGVIPEHDHDLYLGHELGHVYNTPFWFNFVKEAEIRMEAIGAESRGVVDGDLALPGCNYISLRNEAYVSVPVHPSSDIDHALSITERPPSTSLGILSNS